MISVMTAADQDNKHFVEIGIRLVLGHQNGSRTTNGSDIL